MGLQVIDISDPTSPSMAGSYDTPGYALGLYVEGDYAYIADEIAGGLQIIDISDPSNPTPIDYCDTPDAARSVHVSGKYAYVADCGSGLQVIKVHELVPPSRASITGLSGGTWDVQVDGNHAFVANGNTGMRVFDITDPSHPILSSAVSSPGAYSIRVSGDYAYQTCTDLKFQSLDISDPMNPMFVDSCDISNIGHSIIISGDYAYITILDSGLKVVDISDPSNLTVVGGCDLPGGALGIDLAGNYAYVTDWSTGLQVIDITNPTSPTIAGSNSSIGSAASVCVQGDHAFIVCDSLIVLDISDPTSPTVVGGCATPPFPYNLDVCGHYAFVAASNTITVIDISDPSNPVPAEQYICDHGFPQDVYVSGGYVFSTLTDYLDIVRVFVSGTFNLDDNIGRSLVIDTSNDTLLCASLTAIQTDSVTWELSADGGSHWQDVEPDGGLHQFTVPGIDLMWRSTHIMTQSGSNPTVTQLELLLIYESAYIDSIWDIPNDQGRQVSISWHRSGHDYPGSVSPITEYAIYRKIDYDLVLLHEFATPERAQTGVILEQIDTRSVLSYPPGDWHFVTAVPADCEDSYAVVVPTLADSTIDEGMYETTFFVRARTATPGVYFDSAVDSGYSVDNLAPVVPTGLMVAYNTTSGTELTWDECPDADFQYFCVYRGTDESFEPAPENLVHMTISPAWTDPVEEGWRYDYKITAVDFSGNESGAASAGTVTGDETPSVPQAFALHQNVPNPFNPSTVIRFDLPRAAHVGLHIYDVSGRLVRTLVDTEMDAGCKEIHWDGRDGGGRRVASGIYFYRLVAGNFVQTKKMVLLR